MTNQLILVGGGVRSGKSTFALARARSLGARRAFIATAQAFDDEMRTRIAVHRAERPPHWLTLEEPLDLDTALAQRLKDDRPGVILIDCLTLWVANRLLAGHGDDAILAGADELADLIVHRPCAITIVTNEVGAGVHPETSAGLRFRDLLGAVNQRVAAACDRVVLLVAGVPLTVKSPSRPPHDFGQQAP